MVQPSHCCDCNPLELRLQLLCKPLLWNAAVHCCWNLPQGLQACDFIVTFQCLILSWFGSYSHILSWLFFQWLLGFLGVENYWKYNPATLRHSEIGRKRQKNLLLFFFFSNSKWSYSMLSMSYSCFWRLHSWCWFTCGWQCCYWIQRAFSQPEIHRCSFYPRNASSQRWSVVNKHEVT